jgi:hypothetical protein
MTKHYGTNACLASLAHNFKPINQALNVRCLSEAEQLNAV